MLYAIGQQARGITPLGIPKPYPRKYSGARLGLPYFCSLATNLFAAELCKTMMQAFLAANGCFDEYAVA